MLDFMAVTFNFDNELKCFVYSLLANDDRNWRLFIYADGEDPKHESNKEFLMGLNDPRIIYKMASKRFNDYGHTLRDMGLRELPPDSKYVILTNCDNYIMPNMVRHMRSTFKDDPDFVFCNFMNNKEFLSGEHKGVFLNRVWDCQLREEGIDMGCACIKTPIARKVGFKHREYTADWKYFDDAIKSGMVRKILKVPFALFVHN